VYIFWKKKRKTEQVQLKHFVISHFGYRPKDITLFEYAITHPSILVAENKNYSYERLEFLGDTVIDTIVAELLFLKYPLYNEGSLTQSKSRLVSRKTLTEIAQKMNIPQIMRYKKDTNINPIALSGNVLEAIIGAIFLDSGYEQAKRSLLNNVFRKYIDINKLIVEEHDFKSKLIIWGQKHKLKPKFVMTKSEQHNSTEWTYWVTVQINQENYGKGVGKNRKEAEQKAAQNTFSMIDKMGGN